MNKIIILLIGICMGIGGEWLIPEKYSYPFSSACIKEGDDVWLPMISVYNPKTDKYPIGFAGDLSTTSYKSLFDYLLPPKIYKLSTEECNKIIELYIEGEMEHYSQYFGSRKK